MKITLVAFLTCVGVSFASHAQVLFRDDFEQFANGADLTAVNYSPLSGPLSAFVETSIQNGSPTIKVTNFFGSKWAYSDNSVLPLNKNQYKGSFPVQINRPLLIVWKMWIQATNSGPGFIFFSVPVNDADPDVTYNPPLAFKDGGQIYALTNGTSPLVQIGSWGSLAGTVMTNVLILDYPDHVFSYSLNGQTLATLPLGPYFKNVVDAIYFNGFERSTGSLGNCFAIDEVTVGRWEASLGLQWSNSIPLLNVSGNPYTHFVVEYSSNLGPGSWIPFGNGPFTLDNGQFIISDTNLFSTTGRYYRVRLVP